MAGLMLAFAGTNVDGFLCLAAMFAVDAPRSRSAAVLSATVAFALLLVVALAASLAIGRLQANAAWFGIVPAVIGIVRLVGFVRGRKTADDSDWLSSAPSIFAVVLATGVDNVAVYAPLFALRPFPEALAVAAAFLAAWSIGCLALVWVTPDLPRVHAFKRYLEPALAIFFVVVGVAIFVRGGAAFAQR